MNSDLAQLQDLGVDEALDQPEDVGVGAALDLAHEDFSAAER
jgi:hypothetical protein